MCERGFKRLQECWECYSDKLTEPGVYQPLLSITAKLRRGAKAQFKVPHASPFPSRSVLFSPLILMQSLCLPMTTLCPQAQVGEFEKRLTAVHTRGLENVESPEMNEENPKEGGSSKTVMRTPLPARGRARSKRGQRSRALRSCCVQMCREKFEHFLTDVLILLQVKQSHQFLDAATTVL